MLIGPPIPEIRYFKNWPWKSKVKVVGEVKIPSHNVSLTSYQLTSVWFHVNWPSHSWDTASSFKIWRWKSKVKVISEVKVESHNMGPTFGRLTSRAGVNSFFSIQFQFQFLYVQFQFQFLWDEKWQFQFQFLFINSNSNSFLSIPF